MAIVLTNNAKFTPYTFEELIKPYAMYTQEYNTLEENLYDLSSKAELMKAYANSEPADSKVATMYNKYAKDLEKQRDILSSQGLARGRQGLLDLKRRYASEIIPIEQAYSARAAEMKEQQAGKLKGIIYEEDASRSSLERYLNNPELRYNAVSGADITRRVADELKNYKNTMLKPGEWQSTASGQLLQRIQTTGLTREDLAEIMTNPSKFPEIHQLIENVITTTGIRSWKKQYALDTAYRYAYEALPAGLGEQKLDVRENDIYGNEYKRWQLKRLQQEYEAKQIELDAAKNAAINPPGGEPTGGPEVRGRELNFPLVELHTESSDFDSSIVEGLYYDKNNDTFSSKRLEELKTIHANTPEDAFSNPLYSYSGALDTSPYGTSAFEKAQSVLHKLKEDYSYLVDDPVKAVQIGAEIEKAKSLTASYGNVVTFGKDNKDSEAIIDLAIKSGRSGTHSGIYELDEKGKVGKEVSKEDLPKNAEGLTLLSTNKGFVYTDTETEGNKYLIKSNEGLNNHAKEIQKIDEYTTNFTKNATKIVELKDALGNPITIAANGMIPSNIEREIKNTIVNMASKNPKSVDRISDNAIAVTFRQGDGDIIKAVVTDYNTSSPLLVYTTINDILLGGRAKSQTMNRYRTASSWRLRDASFNETPSVTLSEKDEILVP
jgi:hypothetical protein